MPGTAICVPSSSSTPAFQRADQHRLTYSLTTLTGSADNDVFTLNPATGVLSVITLTDYENRSTRTRAGTTKSFRVLSVRALRQPLRPNVT